MSITNSQSGTNVHEVADRIYRINTPVTNADLGGFSFNQYLIVDDAPLLFHTGPRRMFPLVREAVASVMPVAAAALRFVLALRGGRMRVAQRVARGGTAVGAAVRQRRRDDFDRRRGRSSAARDRRW